VVGTERFVGFVAVVRSTAPRGVGRLKRASTPGNVAADETDDPVLTFLARAPVDDEPVTADDERAIAEGWDAHHRGESASAADAKQQTLSTGGTERVVPV
jgi:hypothetical protein